MDVKHHVYLLACFGSSPSRPYGFCGCNVPCLLTDLFGILVLGVCWCINLCLSTSVEDIVQELCESRGGRPELSVLTSLLVSVDVKNY